VGVWSFVWKMWFPGRGVAVVASPATDAHGILAVEDEVLDVAQDEVASDSGREPADDDAGEQRVFVRVVCSKLPETGSARDRECILLESVVVWDGEEGGIGLGLFELRAWAIHCLGSDPQREQQ
jgi:hypothetical protein